ncbi:MAG: efflux RND transporter periplasmic adaptor subunit [Candidatus Omnitrophica bacterium]|nr:efflux RND transporter periplasmic adaptor subunit [Candidatus Omnitrophota bacterium]
MKRVKYPIIILAVLFLGFGDIACAEEDKCKGEHAEHGEHGEHNEVAVSKGSQELIAVKTTEARLTPFEKKISVVGQIAQDAENTVNVPPPGSGTVTDCRAAVGSIVKKDDVLCIVTLANASSPIEIKSPVSGVVVGSSAKTGDKVDTVSSLHTIADISALQATFDVHEKDVKDVKMGQRICVRSVAYPDVCFYGEIIFISPRVDRDTNTIKVRASISNPEYLLKLGMFVTAEISVPTSEQYVVVPLEAVHSSDGKKMVFVKTGEEKFEAREVTVKERSGGQVALSTGVGEGDQVVTENSFLLKSELLKSKMGAGCAE